MIEVDVRKTHGSFRLDLAFQTPIKGVLGLVGPSGAGKSTLFALISGMNAPDDGRIAIGGLTLFDHQRGIDIPSARRRVGIVFQDPLLFPHLNVRGNLLYASKGRETDEFDKTVQVLGLEKLLKRRPHALSGGERQRVAIGRALLSNPQLLLLDEPLSALDQDRKSEVLEHLLAVRTATRVPMIYISHASDEIRKIADRVLAIRDGSLVSLSDSPIGLHAERAVTHNRSDGSFVI
ncbi:MAG: ATP-binding cassette domain-containing protein [Pseudomonadota bacterium]